MKHSLYILEWYQTKVGQVVLDASGDAFDYYDYDKDPHGKKRKPFFMNIQKFFRTLVQLLNIKR